MLHNTLCVGRWWVKMEGKRGKLGSMGDAAENHGFDTGQKFGQTIQHTCSYVVTLASTLI